MQKRIAIVLNSLKNQVLERKEVENGFAYRFAGTDKVVDELVTFMKTEHLCCDFFTFRITVPGDGSEVWLEITGPPFAEEFILTELEF